MKNSQKSSDIISLEFAVFPCRFDSPQGNCGFGHIYWKNP